MIPATITPLPNPRLPHYRGRVALIGAACGPAVFERIATLTELPAGTMRRVTVSGCDVLIANIDGVVCAADNLCTHEDASLAHGVLSGAIVRCPLHGATFDLRDGAPLDEPAEVPLRCHEVRIENDAVFVRLNPE